MKKKTLQNGLRVLTVPVANSKTATVLVLAGVGSKYEEKRISGISHFLEHMYFKGTKKRPNHKSVAETLDKIGGAYNAFTGDEYTGYYAKTAAGHFDVALEWVSDIFLNSTLPEKEVVKEKGIIIEEINMIKDHPMSYIQELWAELLYGNQPAGWSIAGTKKSVLSISRKDLLDYMSKGYSASNTLVCVAGAVKEDTAEKMVEKYFSKIQKKEKPGKKAVIERQKEPAFKLEKKETDQIHLCLGVRSYDFFHPDRYVLNVIETILGKMMSSRLFVKVREELGAAYYIKTESENTTDSGFLATRAGVDIRKIEKVISAIMEEYKKMASRKVPFSELEKAKENIKGRTALALESSSAQAFFYGAQELLEEKTLTPDQIFKKIDKITSDDVKRVSKDIFRPEKINLAMIGPAQKEKKIKKLLRF